MTSRTPIRLTPHRGPLATPSTSPESSPTSSTPPSDISDCSSDAIPTLDVAILHHRISTLGSPMQHEFQALLRRGREVNSWLYLACDLAKSTALIFTFCFLIWGVLEWSSYASLRQQPSPWISEPRLPLPNFTKDIHLRVDPFLFELGDGHAAILQFLSEQIQHAKALSSLSAGLGLPLHALLQTHQASISKAMALHPRGIPYISQEASIYANLTEFLDPTNSLLDFTSGSFIGKSFTLALDELGNIISGSEPMVSFGPSAHRKHQDTRLYAIYWRTTSNLLLEYSAARSRARRLSQHLHVLQQRLLPLVSNHRAVGSKGERSNIWWLKGLLRKPTSFIEEEIQVFVTRLETTLVDVRQLLVYLDWITAQLAQTTLEDVLNVRHKTDLTTCMMSLQDLFARTKPSAPKRLCFCLNSAGLTLPAQPERVEIVVPGSPTVRAGR